eukprot:TRINITY_DN6128_c0_g1_i2.p1 TRINITY_DN6128_c0_g1~~TRINITY_DN6128_c0_g1_i2.p1  ORF type:complete len:314 (+),score=80.60 TRINITY_DN6128_c0_g1_i2:364-1305(+)
MHDPLRAAGWKGYWIDAASSKRMDDDTVIVLPPVNRGVIEQSIKDGTRTFAGGNCTVSLMLIALGGLFERDEVEWLTSMTYQAASGAGAKHMQELAAQMGAVHASVSDCLGGARPPPGQHIAAVVDDRVTCALRGGGQSKDGHQVEGVPTTEFTAPLAGSLLPWIDRDMGGGLTREEWKGGAETNKILGREACRKVPVDGLCVRVGVMRCHSQAFMIKLKRPMEVDEVAKVLAEHNPWCKVVPNEKEATLERLTPAAVSGGLDVHVGRLRQMAQGPEYLAAFSVGDQLLWGAAEPLRVVLRMLLASADVKWDL